MSNTARQARTGFLFSMVVDAFLGSGVPVAGHPYTTFQIVPALGLRTATVLNNCNPVVGDVVKARFIATNCAEAPLEIVPASKADGESSRVHSADSVVTLLPGEWSDYSVFRSWDAPGKHQLTLAFKVGGPGCLLPVSYTLQSRSASGLRRRTNL